MAGATPNGQHERLRIIEQRVRADGSVRIDDLARELDVSEMTIRRDLAELEQLGVARRIRGGAVAVGPRAFAERHRHNARAKAIIADKLVRLVPDRGTVAFDASSTVHRMAHGLDHVLDLLVVTNGIDSFEALTRKAGVTAILTGGWREPHTGSLVGPVVARTAQDFLFDLFICSAAAYDLPIGSSEVSPAEADVKRAMADTSSRIVLAVDHTKLETRAQSRVFEPGQIDVLVTDLDPDDPRMGPYRDLMREVL